MSAREIHKQAQCGALDRGYMAALHAAALTAGGPIVCRPFQKPQRVKNLGWLIRHASEVTAVAIMGECLVARGGRPYNVASPGTEFFYVCDFASAGVLREWIQRRCLAHAALVEID